MRRNLLQSLCLSIMTGTIVLSFLSCDNIYDDPSEGDPSQHKKDNTYTNINATEYTNWVYLDLKNGSQKTLLYDNMAHIPAEWHFALHHYDCKTNGGAALETAYADLETFRRDAENGTDARPSDASFKPDVADRIIIDMSGMMQGKVIYANTPKNKEQGKWLDVNMSTMPPTYKPSEKVYLLLMKDKTIAAIRFTGFANPNKYNIKGYISFDYIYPVKFKD